MRGAPRNGGSDNERARETRRRELPFAERLEIAPPPARLLSRFFGIRFSLAAASRPASSLCWKCKKQNGPRGGGKAAPKKNGFNKRELAGRKKKGESQMHFALSPPLAFAPRFFEPPLPRGTTRSDVLSAIVRQRKREEWEHKALKRNKQGRRRTYQSRRT